VCQLSARCGIFRSQSGTPRQAHDDGLSCSTSRQRRRPGDIRGEEVATLASEVQLLQLSVPVFNPDGDVTASITVLRSIRTLARQLRRGETAEAICLHPPFLGGAKGIRTPALTRQDADLPAVSLRPVPSQYRSLPVVSFSVLDGVKTDRPVRQRLPAPPTPNGYGHSEHREQVDQRAAAAIGRPRNRARSVMVSYT
jgi:hypothetical protein